MSSAGCAEILVCNCSERSKLRCYSSLSSYVTDDTGSNLRCNHDKRCVANKKGCYILRDAIIYTITEALSAKGTRQTQKMIRTLTVTLHVFVSVCVFFCTIVIKNVKLCLIIKKRLMIGIIFRFKWVVKILKVWLVTAENLSDILPFFFNNLFSLIGKLILLESDNFLLLPHRISLETWVFSFQFSM
jgi:hypothetical protein